MFRLGAQLTLRTGREPLARLLVTAAAVAIGVAIMLCVLADFNAFRTTNNRPAWEATQGRAVTTSYASAKNAELWDYSNDVYRGQTIERLDVAALGPGAPVPPGITRLPGPGQYYASPALAALLRTVPAGELGDRFPGRLAGTIGQAALTGPAELVIYVGDSPPALAQLPATTVVSKIAVRPGPTVWTHFFRDAFVAGAIAFVFPILILIGTATRLAAARREERYAALRLVGATSRQIADIAAAEAAITGLLGTVLGIGIFAAVQPALAASAITSARYFASQVTPGATGFLAVLLGVPLASAAGALISLRRVRISPLGVSRRVTPAPPSAWRILPLVLGVVAFVAGIATTDARRIGPATFPGLLVILAGLVVGGPWLTAQSARLLRRLAGGASPLLAARRLADNPKVAFRSVSGLVLAVFLGTVVAGVLPAVESLSASPRASALTNVLLDGFVASPVCGNDANCTGYHTRPLNLLAGSPAVQHQIAEAGLPPRAGATLLTGLRSVAGVTVVPVYSPAGAGPGQDDGDGVISCAGLRELAVLGQCRAGLTAVSVPAQNLFGDNPQSSTQAIASPSSPGVSGDLGRLYLQAVLVKTASAAVMEQARTYLVTHTPDSQGGSAARTFGEAVQARAVIANTVQRLIDTAVILTLIVAGCSLAVSVGGSLVERKRPFTLLRVTGTSLTTLYRVVLLESALPLIAATVVAGGLGYFAAATAVAQLAPAGTAMPAPGAGYYLMLAGGLAGALAVILTSLPLLRRLTAPAGARFE